MREILSEIRMLEKKLAGVHQHPNGIREVNESAGTLNSIVSKLHYLND